MAKNELTKSSFFGIGVGFDTGDEDGFIEIFDARYPGFLIFFCSCLNLVSFLVVVVENELLLDKTGLDDGGGVGRILLLIF